MSDKLKNGNAANRKGRPVGSVNKTTSTAKAIIQAATEKLGGTERLVEWAMEAPENEKAFWSTIFPKLLPVQVTGPGEGGEHFLISRVERVIVKAPNTNS